MSTSILYHGFGLVGYEYIRTRYEGGAVIFSIKRKREKIRCPVCRSRAILFRGKFSRRFRIVPIGLKRVFLDYEFSGLNVGIAGISARRSSDLPIPGFLTATLLNGMRWICRNI